MEELFSKMKKEFDTKKRREIALEIQKEVLKSNAHFFLGHINNNVVSKKNVEGLRVTPLDYTLIDVNTTVK